MFVLILISMTSSRQLWTYLADWLECRGLTKFPLSNVNNKYVYIFYDTQIDINIFHQSNGDNIFLYNAIYCCQSQFAFSTARSDSSDHSVAMWMTTLLLCLHALSLYTISNIKTIYFLLLLQTDLTLTKCVYCYS